MYFLTYVLEDLNFGGIFNNVDVTIEKVGPAQRGTKSASATLVNPQSSRPPSDGLSASSKYPLKALFPKLECLILSHNGMLII